MSQQGLNNFLEAAKGDEDLQNLLFDAEDLEELARAAQARDFDVAVEDLKELSDLLTDFAAAVEEELDEEQLKQVAGGQFPPTKQLGGNPDSKPMPVTDIVFYLGAIEGERLQRQLEQKMQHLDEQSATSLQSLTHKYHQSFAGSSDLMKSNFQTLIAISRNM